MPRTDEARLAALGLLGVPAALLAILMAVYRGGTPDVLRRILALLPQLLTGHPGFSAWDGGFVVNVAVSLLAMSLSLIAGTLLGFGLIAPARPIRLGCTLLLNLLRNSPWLVLIYAMLYLLPFEATLFGIATVISPFVKAVLGLSLPVLANMADIFRGGVATVPAGQWEASRALGYNGRQALWRVVIPQALPSMLPNMMNLYAMLVIGTSLIVVTGVGDVLSMANTVLATNGPQLATAMYVSVLLLFFLYCFPIALGSRWLERRIHRPA